MNKKTSKLILGLLLLLFSCATNNPDSFDVDAEIDYCHKKVMTTLMEIGEDYTQIPRDIQHGETMWKKAPNTIHEWCSGFWPGILWYDYALTGDTVVRIAAENWTEALGNTITDSLFDHDLGIMMTTSYLNGMRFGEKGEKYKTIPLIAADSLCTLYNPNVGTILSWPRHVLDYKGHNTVISNMINLELLLWADTVKTETYPHPHHNYLAIAESHADTTMEYQFRTDYSCYYIAVYDPVTGNHLYNRTHQGAVDESVWARGQSWAIYGYTTMYKYTHEQRYLDFAQKVTDVYLAQLPSDMIPYWDLHQTDYRDASAASVVASALIDLSEMVDKEKGKQYFEAAIQMMKTLSDSPYRSGNINSAFLLHTVGNIATGNNIDGSIIYADYYYLEALYKLKNRKK
ncbi:MAG: glycoside hydrolase family 88 protein [Bacteroidaceae bacterium]|nr:glycoside hydrolase family 88 protein [Bacteroidaceae bacterium]